jgi:hypothetical protein
MWSFVRAVDHALGTVSTRTRCSRSHAIPQATATIPKSMRWRPGASTTIRATLGPRTAAAGTGTAARPVPVPNCVSSLPEVEHQREEVDQDVDQGPTRRRDQPPQGPGHTPYRVCPLLPCTAVDRSPILVPGLPQQQGRGARSQRGPQRGSRLATADLRQKVWDRAYVTRTPRREEETYGRPQDH